MISSKLSALRILFVVFCALGLLFTLPSTTQATDISQPHPDWINGIVTATKLSDYEGHDGDTYYHDNIPCEVVGGYAWGWYGSGWSSWRENVLQNECVVAGTNAYLGYKRILPFGGTQWQQLDLSDYHHPLTFANPGTNGMAMVTNSYADYVPGPSELYYTHDVPALFSVLSKDNADNIVRSPKGQFDHKFTYADGRPLDIRTVSGVSYSPNGKWLYVHAAGAGQLRIDTTDFSVLSFAPSFAPQYGVYTSISSSGNTVATHAYDKGLKLYDLTSCEAEKPDYASRDCASRDLTQTVTDAVKATLPDPSKFVWWSASEVRFVTESKLRLLVNYLYNGEGKYAFFTLETDTSEPAVRYLAMGDSFSSGEGAGNYYEATNFWADENDYNFCHQSRVAYSELLNKYLSPTFYDSVACSGAVIQDVVFSGLDDDYIRLGPPQARRSLLNTITIQYAKQSNLPGYIPQLSLVKENQPSVATISIGGNDIGFKDIITSCVVNISCYSSRDDREKLADLIASKIPKLSVTFATIKQTLSGPDPKLYVLGYPQMFAESTCGQFMDLEEQTFANSLVNYLNASIKLAAERAGVFYVDVTHAFLAGGEDHRICGNAAQAAHGFFFDAKNMPNSSILDALEHALVSSYHPKALGYQLLAGTIRQQTDSLTRGMPVPRATSERPIIDLYRALVGDTNDAYRVQGSVSQDLTKNIVVEHGQSISVAYSIGKDDNGLPVEDATITVVAQSTPVTLGTMTVQADGTAAGEFVIPSSLEPGVHTLRLLYNDIGGQAHDVYQYLYVIASATDFDGDGIPNDQEVCVMGGALGVDRNGNGIDDACDTDVTLSEQDGSNESEKSPIILGENTQSAATKQAIAKFEIPAVLTDVNLHFGASLDAYPGFGFGTNLTPTQDTADETAPFTSSEATNTKAYSMLAVALVLTVVVLTVYFIKHRRL